MLELIAFAFLTLIATAAIATATYLYGQKMMLLGWLVEGKRDKRRYIRELSLWQNKLLVKAGVGSMVTHAPPVQDRPMSPPRKFISPSEANYREQQKRDGLVPKLEPTPQVPPAIATNFMKDAGAVVASR